MKRSLLKISAMVLVFTLVFACFSFSSIAGSADITKPTISLVSNNSDTSAAPNTDVQLDLTAVKLDDVKGMDLTITSTNGATIKALSGDFYNGSTTSQIALAENTNFTRTTSQVRIVCAFVKKPVKTLSAKLTVTANAVGKYNFTVTAKLVKANETLYSEAEEEFTTNSGSLVLSKYDIQENVTNTDASNLVDTAEYFIPYAGLAYKDNNNNWNYPEKDTSTTKFNLINVDPKYTFTYRKFRVPTNDGLITTFTSSKSCQTVEGVANSKNLQFASYAMNKKQTHGTLLIKGDFDAFCTAMKSKFTTKQEIVNRIAVAMEEGNYSDGVWGKIPFNNGTKDTFILAVKVDRKVSMWEGAAENGPQQYALRVYNIADEDIKYTAVGYTKADSKYKFSDEFQSTTYKTVE